MDWTQVITILGGNLAMLLWATRQARDDDIRKIRQLRADGIYGTKIAKIFGVTNPMIYYICNNKNWTHIN